MKNLARVLGVLVVLSLLWQASSGSRGLLEPLLARAQDDSRYFAETGFRISDDGFWDYYQRRGGLRTFGYPVSRKFTLLGTQVQIFQRRIMQIQSGGGVGLLNLLDTDMLPYTSINGATLPAKDDGLVAQAPGAGSPGYDQAILQFVRGNSSDSWNGLPTNFYSTFRNTVSLQDAYPDGGGDPGWLPGMDLEMWGVTVSQPALDPNNGNFAYLRYQRGIMHYDATVGLTQGLLLADYFKSILTGSSLPPDLASAASNSRYFRQYDNSKPDGMARPSAVPGTDLRNAFEKEGPQTDVPAAAPPAAAGPPPASADPPPAAAVSPPAARPAGSLAYGMQVQMLDQDQNRILSMVRGAGFGWIKQQVRWNDVEGIAKGDINWQRLDPVVNNASAQGVKVMFSVVAVPSWARADRRITGPPDNLNDLGDFMAALADRYAGRVQAYEVWNEENLSREWASPIDPCTYVSMLQAVVPRIKAADPNAIVITGALTPTGYNDSNIAIDDSVYLNQLYQCQGGVFRTLGDVVGVHAVGYNNAPGDWVDRRTVNNTGSKGDGSFYFRRMWQLHDIMVANGDSRGVWVTEYYWGSAGRPVPAGYEWATDLDDSTVADFFVAGIEMMKAEPWVWGFCIWNLNFRTFVNYHNDETAVFGILNEDWSPRAIYNRLRDMPK